jgi:hypothetical protein
MENLVATLLAWDAAGRGTASSALLHSHDLSHKTLHGHPLGLNKSTAIPPLPLLRPCEPSITASSHQYIVSFFTSSMRQTTSRRGVTTSSLRKSARVQSANSCRLRSGRVLSGLRPVSCRKATSVRQQSSGAAIIAQDATNRTEQPTPVNPIARLPPSSPSFRFTCDYYDHIYF